MSDRKFRFGVVGGMATDITQWTTFAKWAEDAGYDVLLSPDALGVGSPFVALGAAAAVTTRLRLGTFVLAVPLRTVGSIAWDTATVDRVTGGRFELGLGAGRPDAANEAELFGLPWGSGKRRIEQVAEAIEGIRRIYAQQAAAAARHIPSFLVPTQQPHPPIMIAAAGPALLALAAREANTIAFGLAGGATEEALAAKVAGVREQAGDRFDDIELSINIWSACGSAVPPWMASTFGIDVAGATDNKVLSVLNGTPQEAADALLRRRDELGVSYVTVNSLAAEAFAPVLELLSGR